VESYAQRCLPLTVKRARNGHIGVDLGFRCCAEGNVMLTADPSSVVQKRDLHVGGLGAGASGALAAVTDPLAEGVDSWVRRARDTVREADYFVHDQPYAALAVVGLLGLAAGYLLARR
jgi:ElaB/YqjD/DUF883 family membrane-anchored ribosome-binding protein